MYALIQARPEIFTQDPDGSQIAVEQQFLVLLVMLYCLAFFKDVEPIQVVVQILGWHALEFFWGSELSFSGFSSLALILLSPE